MSEPCVNFRYTQLIVSVFQCRSSKPSFITAEQLIYSTGLLLFVKLIILLEVVCYTGIFTWHWNIIHIGNLLFSVALWNVYYSRITAELLCMLCRSWVYLRHTTYVPEGGRHSERASPWADSCGLHCNRREDTAGLRKEVKVGLGRKAGIYRACAFSSDSADIRHVNQHYYSLRCVTIEMSGSTQMTNPE